jgi:hypothetical protein
MRTYGRVKNPDGTQTWVQVSEDDTGNFEYGYATTLIQCLKLFLGESPFWAGMGIPAQRSVIQQIFPDYYVNLTQQYFAPYFANLSIASVGKSEPIYNIDILTTYGTKIRADVAQ